MERREGDWFCPDTSCGNLNFSKRTKCNICGKLRPTSSKFVCVKHFFCRSVFQPSDHSKTRRLDLCGNLNWARRTHCNICNISKTSQEPEDRLGRGGGYFDLFDPKDRKEHDSEDEEYDEFGRKKKKSLKNKN